MKLYIIEILYIIQNEEQQLQRSTLSDDEGKEGPKGCADPEAYPDSEAYHHAAYRGRSTVLRLIIKMVDNILYIFITHF